MTAIEAAEAIRARRVSAVELTRAALETIERHNPALNAFITVTADRALGQAEALDRELASAGPRGPLHGVPIAHKDLIYTAGVRTTSGSKLFADFVPACNAAVVDGFERAGAVMVGKTNLHELAYGITSENPHFGAVRNPHDPSRSAGGSSGGAGVAVATGMALLATGTDTGGSIRIPAAWCGVVGFKPTYGVVSRAGVQPLGFTLDHIGPLAQTVADAALAFDVMCGRARRELTPAARGVRIGIPVNFCFDVIDAQVKDALLGFARRCAEAGAELIEVRVPDWDALNATARLILLAEASALYQPYLNRRGDFGEDVYRLLQQGRLIPAIDYLNAQRMRTVFRAEFACLFGTIDVLLTPTTPATAPPIGQRNIELAGATHDTRILATRLMRGVNAVGLPAISLPCGRDRDGLPIGAQLIGRAGRDARLLDVAAALEQR